MKLSKGTAILRQVYLICGMTTVVLLARNVTDHRAHAQSWSNPTDQKSIGIKISRLIQNIQQSKPSEIKWMQALDMNVDGVVMSDSVFRAELLELVTACSYRTTDRSIGHPAYENVFGPFREFELQIDNLAIAGDSAICQCTYGLYYTGEKHAAGLLKFYRVDDHAWRLDTMNGLLPFLQGEVIRKRMLPPVGIKKKP